MTVMYRKDYLNTRSREMVWEEREGKRGRDSLRRKFVYLTLDMLSLKP